MLKFDIIKSQNLARVGVIHTPHGDIKTPAFVGAATRATVKALTMQQMRDLGSQAILANTYHLILAPGSDLIAEAGGLANFNSWHGPTFTDSGGFQIFSLPDVKITEQGAKFKSHISGAKFEMTPESSMQDQWKIGADIHMAFDHLTKSDSYDDMKEAMERTHRWLDRCIEEHKRLTSAMNGKFEVIRDNGSGIASEPRNDGRERSGSRVRIVASERDLIKKLLEYTGILHEAVSEMAPHKVANYLYELAQAFSRFYENCAVIGSDQEERRLRLVKTYLDTMTHGLGLLGITIPEEM